MEFNESTEAWTVILQANNDTPFLKPFIVINTSSNPVAFVVQGFLGSTELKSLSNRYTVVYYIYTTELM